MAASLRRGPRRPETSSARAAAAAAAVVGSSPAQRRFGEDFPLCTPSSGRGSAGNGRSAPNYRIVNASDAHFRDDSLASWRTGDAMQDLALTFGDARAPSARQILTSDEAVRRFRCDAVSIVHGFLLQTASDPSSSSRPADIGRDSASPAQRPPDASVTGGACAVETPSAGTFSTQPGQRGTSCNVPAEDPFARESLVANTDMWGAEKGTTSAKPLAASAWGFGDGIASKKSLPPIAPAWGVATPASSSAPAWEQDQGDWGFQQESFEPTQASMWAHKAKPLLANGQNGFQAFSDVADYQGLNDVQEDTGFPSFSPSPAAADGNAWSTNSMDPYPWSLADQKTGFSDGSKGLSSTTTWPATAEWNPPADSRAKPGTVSSASSPMSSRSGAMILSASAARVSAGSTWPTAPDSVASVGSRAKAGVVRNASTATSQVNVSVATLRDGSAPSEDVSELSANAIAWPAAPERIPSVGSRAKAGSLINGSIPTSPVKQASMPNSPVGRVSGAAKGKPRSPVGSMTASALRAQGEPSSSSPVSPTGATNAQAASSGLIVPSGGLLHTGAVDEVTRHLLCARSKIEAVELEFANIMSELAAYSERVPPATTQFRSPAVVPTASPPSRPMTTHAEHFFVGTPAPHRDLANSFTWGSASGRQLVES